MINPKSNLVVQTFLYYIPINPLSQVGIKLKKQPKLFIRNTYWNFVNSLGSDYKL